MARTRQTEKNNVIYRFVPKDLERLYLIDLLIIRPTEIFLASALHMQAAVEDLRFKLFPTVNQPFIASTLSKGLKRDTKAHLGSPIGIGKYRDIQSNFMDHHPDPNPGHMGNDIGSLQQGHTASLDTRWYKRSPDLPQGVGKGAMMRYQRASRWWQHITGNLIPGNLHRRPSHAVSQAFTNLKRQWKRDCRPTARQSMSRRTRTLSLGRFPSFWRALGPKSGPASVMESPRRLLLRENSIAKNPTSFQPNEPDTPHTRPF